MIWKQPLTVEGLNSHSEHTLLPHLGIEVVEVGPDFLTARMPVDERTKQPFGFLHGGASVALAESIGSMAAIGVIGDLNNGSLLAWKSMPIIFVLCNPVGCMELQSPCI